MIYLHRYTTDSRGERVAAIAIVEDESRAERWEAQGFTRCTREELRETWRERDKEGIGRLWLEKVREAEAARQAPPKIQDVLDVPPGFIRIKVKP